MCRFRTSVVELIQSKIVFGLLHAHAAFAWRHYRGAVRCERGELPPADQALHKTGREGRRNEVPRSLRELQLLKYFGMRPSSHILDVGCGIGRLAYECASYLDDDATYTGLDISPDVIDWLNVNYAPRLPGFRFDFLDVYSETYRPTGSSSPEQVRFPYGNGQFDVACAFEVFMHVSFECIQNYVREMARVLRPGGLAVVTFVAVYPDEPVSTFGVEYVQVGEGVYTARPDRESMEMAYGIDLMRSALTDPGLDEVECVKGRMHTPPEHRPGFADGVELPPIWHPCDVLAARKPADPRTASRVTGRRLSRRLAGLRTRPHIRSRRRSIGPTGTWPTSPVTTPVTTTPTTPGAPTIRDATPDNGIATISWAPPESDGGSPLTGYAVTAHVLDGPVKTWIFNSTATTQTVTGLTNGLQYRFWVRDYNEIGISAYSTASRLITPARTW
jgi:SAM-dependent methyltransferase